MGTAQRGVSRKKTRGWGRGERNSLFSSLFFSRSLPSRSTPPSERLEQATSGLEPGYKVHGPVVSSYGSVNSKCTHRPPGHLLGICHLVGPGGGDLSENHFPGLGHWSFLLEAVNVVSFSIFHQKIYTHLETFNAPINGSGGCPGGMVTGQIEVRINKTFNLSGGGGEGLGTCDLKKAP